MNLKASRISNLKRLVHRDICPRSESRSQLHLIKSLEKKEVNLHEAKVVIQEVVLKVKTKVKVKLLTN